MSRALQIYYSGFDETFLELPAETQRRIEAKIDAMGRNLKDFHHFRMTGGDRYRLRVGDYRIVYKFDVEKQELYLLAVGHRREIYR